MNPHEIHDLNRMLAEVAGKVPEEVYLAHPIEPLATRGPYWSIDIGIWNPLQNANQMELVKAALRETIPAHSLTLHWGGSQWHVTLKIYNGGEFDALDKSELHAVALAVATWWKERNNANE